MKKIGITTTVPIEVLLAAGYQPADLNNVFINDPDPERLMRIAERDGFPLNCCSWIKGIYGVCRETDIDTVLCVTGGDCSNTIMLMEVLGSKGFNTIPFAYPARPDTGQMQKQLSALASRLGTTLEAADRIREELSPCRRLAHTLDRLTWDDGQASGLENHLWLVSASDFNQDHNKYLGQLQQLVADCRQRPAYSEAMLRLAYIGVPPIYGGDIYRFIERNGARVVYNEIQRQFAMPEPGNSLAEQYSSYTYPYSTDCRLKDIIPQLKKRRVSGVIHYVQAFCHRGISDIIFRESIKIPLLTLEANDSFFLSQHTKTRIEAFIDMLQRRQKIAGRSRQALKK